MTITNTGRFGVARNDRRSHSQELELVYRQGEIAGAWQDVITDATGKALRGAIGTNRLRQLGEQIAPGGAVEYALIEIAATGARVAVIEDLGRRCRRF
jgi:hypothetical protein